jgi:hypothetical protein
MESQAGPPDRVALRASDAERERVAGLLRDAAAEGRITLEELSERVELAWAARTQPELDTVVEDLPDRDAVLTDTRPARAARWIVAVIGNDERSGRWLAAPIGLHFRRRGRRRTHRLRCAASRSPDPAI